MTDTVWLPEAMTRFRCNQQGCCCKQWNIRMDVESVFHIVQELPDDRTGEILDGARVIRDPADGKVVSLDLRRRAPDDRCVFLEPELTCEVHRKLGGDALPKLCQAFPVTSVRHGDRLQLAWDPICPEVLERIAESDGPYPVTAAACGPGTPLASRVVTPQPLPEIEIGGVALTPDELAALSARVTAHLESGARPALDLLASANAAVARAVTGGPDALSLDPDEDVSDFDEFFEWCVGAHDGRTLWGFVRQYRRFVFAVPLPPAPWGDQDALFEYDPDWRAVVDPRDPALDGFLRRYLAHRFFSAFERSPATGFVAFNYGSVNHTLGSAFRVAVGLSRWLGRPVDKDVMKVAVGASEYLFRTLSLPAVAMPWFRLDVNEKLTLLEEDQTPGSTEG